MTEDSSCNLPWKLLVVDVAADRWRWCCKAPWQQGFLGGHGDDHPLLAETRNQFLAKQRPPACSVCWQEEDAGGVSYRTGVTGATTIDQLPPPTGLEFVDLIHGNLCNLRCASCGPISSSQWASLLHRHPTTEHPWLVNVPKAANTESVAGKLMGVISDNMRSLRHVNLYGGEPSIDPGAISMMMRLAEIDTSARSGPIELRVHTNGQWTRDDQGTAWFESLARLERRGWRINIKFSIDAVGEHAAFVRMPTDWELLRWNLTRMVAAGRTNTIQVTASLINLSVMHELALWAGGEPWTNIVRPVPNMVNRPAVMGMVNLGPHLDEFVGGWNDPGIPRSWESLGRWIMDIAAKQRSIKRANPHMLGRFNAYIDWYAKANSVEIPPVLARTYARYAEIGAASLLA